LSAVPLRCVDLIVDIPAVGDRRFTYSLPDALALPPGAKVRVPFGRGEVDGFVAGEPENPPDMRLKPVKAVYDLEFLPGHDLLALAGELAAHYCAPLSSVWSCLWPPVAPKRKIEQVSAGAPGEAPPEAAADTRTVPAHARLLVGGREFRWRQYLEQAREARRAGLGVLVLVPETKGIGDAFSRLEPVFPGEVAKLHSEQTGLARREAYLSLIRGERKIALGTRSAVFAPIRGLGLVIVEDEPSESYKSPDLPFYDSRTVAVIRGRLQGCDVTLGSSHPTVESYWKAAGRILERVDEFPAGDATARGETAAPSVGPGGGQLGESGVTTALVNLRQVKRGKDLLSQPLLEGLRETFERGGRAILFHSRRGDSSQVTCQDCGNTLVCPRCGIPLSYHSREPALICHTCGYSEAPPDVCPACGGHRWKFAGSGIGRVDSELRRLFPDVPAFRMDRDVSKGTPAVAALRAFSAASPACLLATRMVLGFPHVPGVSTVGVVSCDTLLNLPDYRAAEKVFHLLWSLREMVDPALPGGAFIAQTYNPEHRGVRGILDPDAFYRGELADRREFGYPPFGRFFKVQFGGRNPEKVRGAAERFVKSVLERGAAVDVLGPVPSPRPRIRGEHRWQAALRGQDPVLMGSLCRQACEAAGQGGVKVSVDVDPLDMA
jgi:primosomal protein N' (replication factor Y)